MLLHLRRVIMKNDNLIVKKNENKKSGMSNFLSFICEPKVVGTFLVGLVFGLVIMRLCVSFV